MEHKIIKKDGFFCELCKWNWTRKPQSDCPGVKRYHWGGWTPNLKTKTQLRKLGLKPTGQARGAYYRLSRAGKSDQFYWLYEISETEIIKTRAK